MIGINKIKEQEYRNNPCGTYSIPYWKQKGIQIPENMKILHDREFEEGILLEYNDEKYFRLLHDLKNIMKWISDAYAIETASTEDISLMQELINRSYEELSVTYDQLLGYTKSEVTMKICGLLFMKSLPTSQSHVGLQSWIKR